MTVRRLRGVIAALAAWGATGGASSGAISEDRTLLLYNSANADSLAVRNAYVAAHPGVRQLNLNDPTLPSGAIVRSDYLAKVRAPLLAYLAGTTTGGTPLAQHIIAIATTRGLPARIDGGGEFTLVCNISSMEAEMTLLHQNLEAPGVSNLPNRFHSIVDNPYHRLFGQQIDSFSRASITTERAFLYVNPGIWQITGLTPGDIYLVCRLDAAPTPGGPSALQNTIALIDRSIDLRVDPCEVRSLLDEWGCVQGLDDDSFTGLFPGTPDYENTRTFLQNGGHNVTYDATTNFVDPNELPDAKPLLMFATYGENHSIVVAGVCPTGGGENPAGNGTYVSGYTYHEAACFTSLESFNGNSIIDGTSRGNQGQVLDAIASGASFTVGNIAEPFTFSVPDAEALARGLYLDGMTFAEAAYISLPGLSWMQTPVGDPLARVRIGAGDCDGDANADGAVDFIDLNAVLSDFGTPGACRPGDVNRDTLCNFVDLNLVLAAFGGAC